METELIKISKVKTKGLKKSLLDKTNEYINLEKKHNFYARMLKTDIDIIIRSIETINS